MLNVALLILRICLGTIFLVHGAQKTFGAFGGPGIQGFTTMLSQMGFAPASLWAYVAAYAEFIGGLFVILGILTRGAAFMISAVMLVAVFKVLWGKGFFGYEYNLLIIAVCVAFMLLGPGKYSVMKN